METFRNDSRTCSIRVPALILFLMLGAGFVTAGSDEQLAPSYEFMSIELPNGRGELGFTALAGINDRGRIVGGFTVGESQGFILGSRLEISRTGCPNATFTALLGINRPGAIAGSCFDGINHGFLRRRLGEFTLIDVPDALITQARGLNDANQVVGYFRDKTGSQHGFVWYRGTFATFDLPGLQGVIPYPEAINNRGQIVGFYAESPCNCNERGFLLNWGSLETIDFPTATATLLTGMNDRGQIVGVYADANSRHHGFVLTYGHFTTLDVPFTGIQFTEPHGINNLGEIVGRYLQQTDPFAQAYNQGFLAVPKPDPNIIDQP
jgi:probable HAF family extracellular repeat protein